MSLFLKFSFFSHQFSVKIPDVTERLRQHTEGRTRASNLVFTIWAVFGGFILHFLLSNYLTVLLRPKYEEPVETAADLIKRDITPILWPGGWKYIELFAASPDPVYQEISRRFVEANDWVEYKDMVDKIPSTGKFADIGTKPWAPEDTFNKWYRSEEPIPGDSLYSGHIANFKWPLKKVL